MSTRLLRHAERLGGMVLHPKATLDAVIHAREATLLALLPWFALVAFALEPVRTGQALLLFKVGVLDGLMTLVQVFGNRMAQPFVGIVVAAAVLTLVETFQRPRAARHGFDVALDACTFTLVPYLALAAIGRLLQALGADLWFLPHHPLRGLWWERAIELLAAYGWSFALYVVAARSFWGRPRA